ncbi:nitroreductase family protein [Streptococcus cuniculipharyngis]|uniref:Nitroreductase family protein n=1 Tax=Streptococcus cuniculipharyngis TaxID=1562651 RepID=A0A5C5S949_9STRE|nr:nitroreductase family protein [Streptococcus cuniculipharyngis]TWS96936.1 nitroreductase family protein [Streptococcus cuniculipharyngis]
MKFLELNKKRHATRTFNNQPIDLADVKTAIEIATLAPSAHNIQSWQFAIVKDKKAELAEIMYGHNRQQALDAQYVIAVFSDTDLVNRANRIARHGVNQMPEAALSRFINEFPKMYPTYSPQQMSDYLALNAGLVTMNLVLALTDQKMASNIILGFDKTKANAILEMDERYRPEVLITVGYSDHPGNPSYRLPVEQVIDIR